LVYNGFYSLVIAGSALSLSIIMWGVSIPVLLIGLYLIHMEITQMPFSVYEHGLTSNSVSLSDGYHRRQVFIPAPMVLGVDVGEYKVRGLRGVLTYRTLVFRYHDDEKGHDLSLVLSDITGWYQAFLALDKVLEGLIDDDLRESMKELKEEWDTFEAEYG
jgi:hypothetical protein